MPYSIQQVYQSIFKIWRAKRFNLFIEKMEPNSSHRMVDVGGYPRFWLSYKPIVGSIDCVNLDDQPWDHDAFLEYHISTKIGNGCNLDLPDASYDIAFSNSVIEHVGEWKDQVAFAREIRRVGHALWVQTPAYECPVEPHYLAPFVHWLPRNVQRRILRHFTPWGLIAKPDRKEVDFMVDTTRLITRKEMATLFPDCTILTERMLGIIPKSYIAVRELPDSRP